MDQPPELLCDIPASLTFQQLLPCSFSRLKELFKLKNGSTALFFFFSFENAKNMCWTDDAKQRKKIRMASGEFFSFKYDGKNQCVNQDCSMKKEKAFCVNLMCSGIIFQNLVLIWLTFFKKEFTYTYITITTPKGGYPGLY